MTRLRAAITLLAELSVIGMHLALWALAYEAYTATTLYQLMWSQGK